VPVGTSNINHIEFWGPEIWNVTTQLLAQCAVEDMRVETRLICENRGCYPTAIRLFRQDIRPISVTPFDYCAARVLTNRLLFCPMTVKIVWYLIDSTKDLSLDKQLMFSGISNEQFPSRFGGILNTYIQLYLTGQMFRLKTSTT
jgi:hypothetical protein